MNLESLRDFYRRPREIKALEMLQRPESYPGLAPWREHDTRVRFVRLPSFHPYSVWLLQHRGSITQVRRIEWDHIADQRTGDLAPESSPTIYGSDALLPASAAQGVLDELASISLPPFLPVSTIGIDGTTFGISFGDSWRSAELWWWGHPPKEWQALADCYERAITLFEQFLPVSTAQNPQLQTGA